MSDSDLVYCYDTSALVDGLERFYFPERFPGLWERMSDLIDEGRFLISEEVYVESQRVDAALKDWCNGLPDDAVVPTDEDIAAIVTEIASDYPQWVGQGTRNQADPFVIAVAETEGAIIVTGEKPGGPGKPKIPYVGRRRGLEVVGFPDVIIREGWTFG